MADLNDFHAFTSTSSGSGESSGGGSGCANGFIWILAVIGILYLIGKLCG